MRRTFIIAATIFLLDAFCLNQGILAFILIFYTVLFILPRALSALKNSNSDNFKYLLKKTIVYLIVAIAVFETNSLNNKIARNRAEKLVVAVKTFHSKYNYYPAKLEDLVPEFLPSIPLAKYTLCFNTFTYLVSRTHDRHLLMYIVVPPFGRRCYNFETDKWGSLN